MSCGCHFTNTCHCLVDHLCSKALLEWAPIHILLVNEFMMPVFVRHNSQSPLPTCRYTYSSKQQKKKKKKSKPADIPTCMY